MAKGHALAQIGTGWQSAESNDERVPGLAAIGVSGGAAQKPKDGCKAENRT
jgi:hypothetical protein